MDHADVKQAIETANEAVTAAYEQADAAALAAGYTEDGQILAPQCDIIKGRQAIQDFWQMNIDMGLVKGARSQILELEVHADRAIEIGTYTLQAVMNQLLDTGKYMLLWQFDGEQWKRHREIWNSSMPARK